MISRRSAWLAASLALNLGLAAVLIRFAMFPEADVPSTDLAFPQNHILANDTPDIERRMEGFTDRDSFLTRIYGGLADWNPFAEQPIVSSLYGFRFLSRFPAMQQTLIRLPKVEPNIGGAETLFTWALEKDRIGDFCRLISADDDTVTCDHTVSAFRTFLFWRGILSRVVVFEGDDGHGGGSHTFTEVWDPHERAWRYFDPFLGAYSVTHSAADLVREKGRSGLRRPPFSGPDAARRDAARAAGLKDLFEGNKSHLWFVENGLNGRRIEFRNPAVYQGF